MPLHSILILTPSPSLLHLLLNPSLYSSIAQLLIKLQQTKEQFLIEVSGIRTQVDSNSDDIKQFKHRKSELKDTIDNVRDVIVNFY